VAFNHGKKQVIKLDNSAGTLVDLSTYHEEVTFPRTIENAETTTLGANSKTRIVGVADGNIGGSGKWDPTLDAHMANVVSALLAGTLASVSYEYGPAGSTTGYVKYSGECLINNYEISGGIGDAMGFSWDGELTGDVTRGTWA
jgi:hypothetical protein